MPLIRPPVSPAAVGFLAVEAPAHGLNFTNVLPPILATQNQNLMNGSGVAAGDFDGDGRCDLYFCAIQGTNALFRNRGDWRFEDVTTQAGLGLPLAHSTGAVWADLDGDRDLDLLVSTLGTGVKVFRNEGAGRFQERTAESGTAAQTGSMSLALGDVDGDGDLDLFVANYGAMSVLRSGGRAELKKVGDQWVIAGPHAHRLRYVDGRVEEVGEAPVLYLNDGKGRFQPVPWGSPRFLDAEGRPKPAPLDYGLSVQIRDVNGDGVPDIYVCNDYQTPDRLWLNEGRGTFREASWHAVRKFPFSSMGVDFGDLDRDGHLDFLAVEMASRDPVRRQRQVMGAPAFQSLPGRFMARPQVARNTLYHGNGDGTWSELAEFAGLAATDWSWQPVFLDVDLDGFEDVLVVSGMLLDLQDRDTLLQIQKLGKQPTEIARTNLLLYPSFPSPIAAFRNRGDLTFEDRGPAWGFAGERIAQGIALADLDGDGDLDAAINCLNSPAMLYRNQATASLVAVRLAGRAPNTQGIGARVRVRGGALEQSQEIVAGGRYLSGDDTVRTFAAGSASSLTLEVQWRSGMRTVVTNARPNHVYTVTEDAEVQPPVPAAKRVPTAWVDATGRLGHTHQEEPFDDYARQPLLFRQLSSSGPSLALVDLDGDDREELVIGTGRGGTLGAYRLDAAGAAFALGGTWVAPDDVLGMAPWVDAQGRPSLLATVATYEAGITGSPVVEITQPTAGGPLRVEPLGGVAASAASPGVLATGDLDGDGDLDLFVGGRVLPGGYPQPIASRLFRRKGRELSEDGELGRALAAVGMVTDAAWVDLEGDGFPELVLTTEWGAIRIWRNQAGQLAAWDPEVRWEGGPPESLARRTGWWTGLVPGDFDGDGRLDLAVGNWGLNTGYEASLERPLTLYYGDLSGAGLTDLVEGYTAGGGLERPRRGLNALGQALPSLWERFPNHAAFASARMSEVLGSLPGKARVVAAVELRSVVLLNRAQGWEARPLPAGVQWSPAFGLAVADGDGDGRPDLFVAQNFFANRPEWPRTDAGRGLWLRGDGQGGFQEWKASDSGVQSDAEQRGVLASDWDGDGRVDVVLGQNGAATRWWLGRRTAPGWEVRLVGPPGNPSGRGAVVRWSRDGVWGSAWVAGGGAGYGSVAGGGVLIGGGEPGQVEVRWPGGRIERVDWPAGARRVRVGMGGKVEAR